MSETLILKNIVFLKEIKTTFFFIFYFETYKINIKVLKYKEIQIQQGWRKFSLETRVRHYRRMSPMLTNTMLSIMNGDTTIIALGNNW